MALPSASELLAAATALRACQILDLRGLPLERRAAVQLVVNQQNDAAQKAADVLDRVLVETLSFRRQDGDPAHD